MCTLFNFLNFLIAALLFYAGAYSNMLFIAIIILNIIIGIAQELKAKKLVDELSILNRPTVRVRREGKETGIAPEEVVKDDLLVLESGSQICNDAEVVSGQIEVNESLLTGESDAVAKEAGDELYSGSFVMAGRAYARVIHVREENYASRLVNEVRKEKKVDSELLVRNTPANEAIVSSAAALLGMLPKGLVLLISVSLAAGVIRLARMKILVQNIFSLETLAHVDTICLDKTGTLTDGRLKVRSILPVGEVDAAEKLFGPLPENLEQELEKGRRLVAIGYSGKMWEDETRLPEGIQPLYSISLEDTIRPCANQILEFFRKEGVETKIISGDHVKTVSMIAKRAGVHGWKNAIDLSEQAEEIDYDAICQRYTVFARTTPGQKWELIRALKRQGHHVAMTGDGVNDLLALREADCSIAVADGSDASRQISQVVLLDSDFTNLPQVVMEGRRVIHNVTRTAQVFFIKTIYSVLVSRFCLVANQPFPFIPIQITLIDAFVEAWPAFLTILEADTRKVKGSFLRTALSNAAPFGLTVTVMIAAVSMTTPFLDGQNRTVMYLLLILISMTAVLRSCIPLTKLRAFVCITMILGCFGALAILPSLFELSPISFGMAAYVVAGYAAALVLLALLEGLRRLLYTANQGKTSDSALR